ncbi:MAG: hypothetical protein WDN01_04005 [Rhizomicrobium sp.]
MRIFSSTSLAAAFLLVATFAASAQKVDQPKPSIYEKPSAANGTVKVCKIADSPDMIGIPFEFSDTQGINRFFVPAGPAPGGYCIFGRYPYPIGSTVTIVETPTLGYTVTDIATAIAARLKAKDPQHASVTVEVGPGVTEIFWYQHRLPFGPLEICKLGNGISGNAVFSVDGMKGTITVPAGACSPAIQVPSGPVTIREVQPPPGAVWTNGGCRTLPANRQVACDDTAHASTVQIVGGDNSVQTIAIITDQPSGSSTVYDPNHPAEPNGGGGANGPAMPDNNPQTPIEQPR